MMKQRWPSHASRCVYCLSCSSWEVPKEQKQVHASLDGERCNRAATMRPRAGTGGAPNRRVSETRWRRALQCSVAAP